MIVLYIILGVIGTLFICFLLGLIFWDLQNRYDDEIKEKAQSIKYKI